MGATAEREGLFARLAKPLAGLPIPLALLGLLGLDALVTAIMNLDTAAAFMTPLMIYAARGLGADEAPFLYGAVLMANAGSLFLPGSNLTNLLVDGQGTSGAAFLSEMFPAAIAAVAITGAGLLLWSWRLPRSTAEPHHQERAWRPGPGVAATVVAAVLVIALSKPALPVLVLGVALGAWRLERETFVKALGPLTLLALLVVAVALGTFARAVDLTVTAGRFETAFLGAGASIVINNLPAATLLSAHAPTHPHALLLGLNLGPNLAVTGSLSALIWWRSARALNAHPSAVRYSLVGAPLAIVALLVTLNLS